MIIYYKGAGVIASIVLFLNLLFSVAMLSMMGFTLTLTSLAGLLLNIAMAVDSNIIIHERIKEELALGRGRKNAIDVGFSRAAFVIIDANITTLIAAVALSLLASGTIKGFAITLCVGIVSTLFTSLFVSRLLFDVGTEQFRKQKVSIGWGVKQ
jgi:preprotein translocase subunit SecD